MICKKCKQAGDALELSRKYEEPRFREFERDHISKARYLHTKCEDPSCLCQHKVDKKLISN